MGDLSKKTWVKWPSDEENNVMPLWLDRKMYRKSYVMRFDVKDMTAFRTLCTAMGHQTKKDPGTTKQRLEVYFKESNDMATTLHDITVLINFNRILRVS
jgi:hypothetical protein